MSKSKAVSSVPAAGLKCLRARAVLEKLDFSRATLYRQIKENKFPRPFDLNAGQSRRPIMVWLERDIDHWIESRIQQAQGARNAA